MPKADRAMPLAYKWDYLIPRLKPPSSYAGCRRHRLSQSAEGCRMKVCLRLKAPQHPPPSSAAELPAEKATPHHQARARHDRDVCAARGLRREDLYQDNRWRSWRCVRSGGERSFLRRAPSKPLQSTRMPCKPRSICSAFPKMLAPVGPRRQHACTQPSPGHWCLPKIDRLRRPEQAHRARQDDDAHAPHGLRAARLGRLAAPNRRKREATSCALCEGR
jgi:hypothetical protein